MSVSLRIRNALLNPAWVCFTWLGMTVGVSMIATPVRFTADSITRAVALDVGRVVFAALNKAELIALIVLLVIVRVSDRSRDFWAWCSALILIVLAQGAWLTPELSARTDIILAGGEPPPSYAHAIYSTLELLKIGLLLFLGVKALADKR
jgi:hypothetical protein